MKPKCDAFTVGVDKEPFVTCFLGVWVKLCPSLERLKVDALAVTGPPLNDQILLTCTAPILLQCSQQVALYTAIYVSVAFCCECLG